jgi:hypothetical protein
VEDGALQGFRRLSLSDSGSHCSKLSLRYLVGTQRACQVAVGVQLLLLAWEHKAILAIATLLLGSNASLPEYWPEDRYDLVWAFHREGEGWHMTQIPQLLLAGDRAGPIE